MPPTRQKASNRRPELDVGLKLDRELNDNDIYVIEISGKEVVGTKQTIEKFTGIGKVKIRFINKDGRNTIHYK